MSGMSYRIQIQEEARIEMREAYLWYELQREGLGDEFIKEIEVCMAELAEHPQHYTQFHPYFRRIRSKRFPYKLFYEIGVDVVIVTRIRHDAQRSVT